MEELKLFLDELDCANCANEIEREVQRQLGNSTAAVSFAAKTLTLNIDEGADKTALIKKIEKIVKRVESGVHVSVQPNKKSAPDGDRRFFVWFSLSKIIFAGAILLICETVSFANAYIELAVALTGYIAVGYPVIMKAVTGIFRGRFFDENMLMFIATLGAVALGEYHEAVAVMFFYQIGELLQSLAVGKTRKSIARLMDIRPESAIVLEGGKEIVKSPEEVRISDRILIKAGARIPLDGRVVSGGASLDAKALTGESAPISVRAGSEVLSGAINLNGRLEIEVLKEYNDSAVSKILALVENAGSKKATTENFISKFARFYTPVVVGLALLICFIPPIFSGFSNLAGWIERGLVFLVISCPCALVISVPLSFFGGIGSASRKGILIKGSNHLEAISAAKTVVFDKTGTLTKGEFMVVQVCGKNGFSEKELIELTANLEQNSTHPIAKSILQYAGGFFKKKITGFKEEGGEGISARVDGTVVFAGSRELLIKNGISVPEVETYGTVVYVGADKTFAGFIVVADSIKPDSVQAIASLRTLGIERVYLLTGDNKRTGAAVANQLSITDYYASLLPHQKVEKLEEIMHAQTGGKVVFVGDGINDAPALARADVGIAMGGVGSDAAIEAADIVLMNDSPSKIAAAIRISRRTKRIVWQNIVFALGIKVVVLALGAFGLVSMWLAVFADVGVTLLAVLNSMRALKSV